MLRLDKKKIFFLHQHYLLGRVEPPGVSLPTEKEKQRFIWLTNCLEKEKHLRAKVSEKLKTGWEFSRLPPLEQAVLIYATYELLLEKNKGWEKMIIDQTINFSKVYCGEEKYKYINKVLDLIMKENISPPNLSSE